MSVRRALVIDDEAGIRTTLSGILRDEGIEVALAEDGAKGLELCRREDFDVVLLDVWMPGRDGLDVLGDIRALPEPPEVVMISGHGSVETAVRATKGGAFDFLEKPLSLEKTILTVRHALDRRMQSERQRAEREAFLEANAIVGRSETVLRLIEEIHRAAPTSGRVLIYGENGSGKELVARHVHFHSQRRNQAFVEVNCAAIPDELIESELFGHVRGAFTGALVNKRGRFALADRGTLFLDEIGDMSLRTQARVLRTLQDQVIQPVGSTENVEVDVRVIAATNKVLEDEIAAGRFREDLFFRLNVVPFLVPPLRERREDIPLLLSHFFERTCREHGRPPKRVDDSALEACVAYRWPGNVRELRNVVERLVIMEPSEVVGREHLPRQLRGEASAGLALQTRYGSLKEAREAFEREYILRTLREQGGNVSAAARALGLDRSSLYRRARSLAVPLDELREAAD